MPELMWLYLTALRDDRTSGRGVAWAEALETMAHDRLTRLLQAKWSGHTLLAWAVRTLFVWPRGDRSLDDTVRPQPGATAMEGGAWVFASPERRPVYGFSRVLLVWTAGRRRRPLGMRRWHNGGPSTDDLALAWLSDARHRRRCRPAYGLFEAWYPSKRRLKRRRGYGWDLGCRLQQNRRGNGQTLRTYRRHPAWAAGGGLTGGLQGLGVRDGAQDYATHRLRLPAAEVRRLSRVRSQREAVRRVCQAQLRRTGWQARSARAQRPQLMCCVVACGVRERERPDRQRSIDKLTRQLSGQGRALALPVLERLKRTA
jgi:hypothetical protein